jgi:hypothetical protein
MKRRWMNYASLNEMHDRLNPWKKTDAIRDWFDQRWCDESTYSAYAMRLLRYVQVWGGPYDNDDVSEAYIFRVLDWVSALSFFISVYNCGRSWVCVCLINVIATALRLVYNLRTDICKHNAFLKLVPESFLQQDINAIHNSWMQVITKYSDEESRNDINHPSMNLNQWKTINAIRDWIAHRWLDMSTISTYACITMRPNMERSLRQWWSELSIYISITVSRLCKPVWEFWLITLRPPCDAFIICLRRSL